MTLWNIHSIYTAASITPDVAIDAYRMCDLKVPTKIRNSPTKPFKPGSPMDESVTIMKNTAKTGICLARPPKSAIMRVCLLS